MKTRGSDPRFKFSHRAIGLCEAPRNLDLGAEVMRSRRDPRQHVTRGQAHGDAIRVVHYDGIIDPKTELGGRRPPGLNGTLDL